MAKVQRWHCKMSALTLLADKKGLLQTGKREKHKRKKEQEKRERRKNQSKNIGFIAIIKDVNVFCQIWTVIQQGPTEGIWDSATLELI